MPITSDLPNGHLGLAKGREKTIPLVPVLSPFSSVPLKCRVDILEMGKYFLMLGFCSSVLFLVGVCSSLELSGLVMWEGSPG